MRTAKLHRKTNETDIRIALRLDGGGRYRVSTGIRFLDHMLELFARHGGFDLEFTAAGDLDVDQHHTVEDVGIALGEAFKMPFSLPSSLGANPSPSLSSPAEASAVLLWPFALPPLALPRISVFPLLIIGLT